MKNRNNAPKKQHHEKTCCAHSSVAETPTVGSETTVNVHNKGKKEKKH